jgi:hypothetical protein
MNILKLGEGIEALQCAFLSTASHRHGLQACIVCDGSGSMLNKADNVRNRMRCFRATTVAEEKQ